MPERVEQHDAVPVLADVDERVRVPVHEGAAHQRVGQPPHRHDEERHQVGARRADSLGPNTTQPITASSGTTMCSSLSASRSAPSRSSSGRRKKKCTTPPPKQITIASRRSARQTRLSVSRPNAKGGRRPRHERVAPDRQVREIADDPRRRVGARRLVEDLVALDAPARAGGSAPPGPRRRSADGTDGPGSRAQSRAPRSSRRTTPRPASIRGCRRPGRSSGVRPARRGSGRPRDGTRRAPCRRPASRRPGSTGASGPRHRARAKASSASGWCVATGTDRVDAAELRHRRGRSADRRGSARGHRSRSRRA